MRIKQAYADVSLDNGALVYRSSYDAGLVAALKAAIPAQGRRWDGSAKAWRVDPAYGQALVDVTAQALGVMLALPLGANTPKAETRLLDVRYVGAAKDRGDGTRVAFGWSGGEWSVVFPEAALREWFAAPASPTDALTLYAVLGVPGTAMVGTIKQAYRRMALQWHPDRCREVGAAEVFIRVQRAYEVLSNPAMRARYDAGLALQRVAPLSREQGDWVPDEYRCPLRCGMILADGCEQVGRFVVAKIIAWEDLMNANRQTLVSSWPMGATAPVEEWM